MKCYYHYFFSPEATSYVAFVLKKCISLYIQVDLPKINFYMIEERTKDLSMDPILLLNNEQIL